MPIYTFICDYCGESTKKLSSSKQEKTFQCSCGGDLKKQLPSDLNSTVMDTRDRYRGSKLRKGHEQMMKKRMSDHHDKYEIEEKIDRNGIKEAERLGWTKKIKRL